jgi:hypothetical protein
MKLLYRSEESTNLLKNDRFRRGSQQPSELLRSLGGFTLIIIGAFLL